MVTLSKIFYRLINTQNNSPSLKVSWGTLYKLPVSPADSLRDVWKKNNFDNNVLNNWSLTIALDLSSLLSPLNKKNTLQYIEEMRTIDELLGTLTNEKQKEKNIYILLIGQIKEQIERLSALVASENVRLLEDMALKDRGIISALEYSQTQLSFNEKQTLLLNLQDDLWLYTLILSYFPDGRF